MDLVLMLLSVAVFPIACLGFLLWMDRIEDSIPRSVARATRTPEPPPVLRIPVRRAGPPVVASAAPGVVIPAQRSTDRADVGTAPVVGAALPGIGPPPAIR